MKEDLEIIKRAEEYACGINPKSKREIKQLVGAYIVGSEDMRRQMFWKVRKAFCKTTCGECPLNHDDIEGGGGLVVQCDKLEMFNKELKGE